MRVFSPGFISRIDILSLLQEFNSLILNFSIEIYRKSSKKYLLLMKVELSNVISTDSCSENRRIPIKLNETAAFDRHLSLAFSHLFAEIFIFKYFCLVSALPTTSLQVLKRVHTSSISVSFKEALITSPLTFSFKGSSMITGLSSRYLRYHG